jgi:hypothetical protein
MLGARSAGGSSLRAINFLTITFAALSPSKIFKEQKISEWVREPCPSAMSAGRSFPRSN